MPVPPGKGVWAAGLPPQGVYYGSFWPSQRPPEIFFLKDFWLTLGGVGGQPPPRGVAWVDGRVRAGKSTHPGGGSLSEFLAGKRTSFSQL